MGEIAVASEQQSREINQLNNSVENVNKITRQNVANAEQSSSVAEELTSQSEEMRAMVEKYVLDDNVGSHRF